MTPTETVYNRVVAAMDGPSSLAAALNLTAQTVSNWRKAGIPARYCKRIEHLSGVSVRALRPSDWADYWPEAPKPTGNARASRP